MSRINSTDTLPALPVLDGVEIRHVPDCPGYAVTDKGSVYSCSATGMSTFKFCTKWRLLRGGSSTGGYVDVKMRFKNLPDQRMKVNVMVLTAFVGPRPEGLLCRHLDGNPSNNELSNLAWGTYSENSLDRSRHGRAWHNRGEGNGQAKLTIEDAADIIRQSKNRSFRDIAKDYNVKTPCVSRIVRGLRWKESLRDVRIEVYGTNSPVFRITENDVIAIRKLKGIETQRSIANRYKVSESAISAIHSGQNWKHIPW